MITAPFAGKCRKEAQVFGVADLPLIVVPHTAAGDVPIGQLAPEQLAEIVRGSVDEIERALSAPAA